MNLKDLKKREAFFDIVCSRSLWVVEQLILLQIIYSFTVIIDFSPAYF